MSTPSNHMDTDLPEIESLKAVFAYTKQTTKLLSLSTEKALARLCNTVSNVLNSTCVILFTHYEEDANLEVIGAYPNFAPQEAIYLNTYGADDGSMMSQLKNGTILRLTKDSTDASLSGIISIVPQEYILLPLMTGERLIGLMLIFDEIKSQPSHSIDICKSLKPLISDDFDILTHYTETKHELTLLQEETEIFRQIDHELSDVTELNFVFSMIMDWALRFTNAVAAGLSLYDAKTGTLRAVTNYGYRPNIIKRGEDIPSHRAGITLRVGRSGLAEIVPDVTVDKDYFSVADGIRTHMSVPILRDDKVIAVLSLESREFNGFTDDHLDFVRKLTNRAGIAVDNARLFAETEREREKLSYILKNIADGVIAIGTDQQILLLNSSAILAFNLSTEQRYEGQIFSNVIIHSKLQHLFTEAVEMDEDVTGEISLSGDKTYYVTINYYSEIGYLIVMQDITHFKEVDKLKTELVATVSHDLKQPLASMRGYLDLLLMTDSIIPEASPYVEKIENGFSNMRQLIDDLLDIAQIESGLTLKRDEVDLLALLEKAIEHSDIQASQRAITVTLDIPSGIPTVMGDKSRLAQVFNNLVSNAVKYTQPEGEVKIHSHVRQNLVRIYVEDNGMGIGPEDLSQIFERFYRVRRPETDSIDGTGLGLAIVKSLIEAHQGKIDVKSELGIGSTFRVTLPVDH